MVEKGIEEPVSQNVQKDISTIANDKQPHKNMYKKEETNTVSGQNSLSPSLTSKTLLNKDTPTRTLPENTSQPAESGTIKLERNN